MKANLKWNALLEDVVGAPLLVIFSQGVDDHLLRMLERRILFRYSLGLMDFEALFDAKIL